MKPAPYLRMYLRSISSFVLIFSSLAVEDRSSHWTARLRAPFSLDSAPKTLPSHWMAYVVCAGVPQLGAGRRDPGESGGADLQPGVQQWGARHHAQGAPPPPGPSHPRHQGGEDQM